MAVRSDICMVLEGTYPYISGGVSSWVHQLLNAFSDYRFSLLVILPTADYGREMKYSLPPNIVEVRHAIIHSYEVPRQRGAGTRREAIEGLRRFVDAILEDDTSLFPEFVEIIAGQPPGITPEEIFFGEDVWHLLTDLYKAHELDISFIDFFWTFRFSMLPLVRALTAPVPQARIYHTISTGYAGLVAAAASVKRPGSACLVTEHGIYAKERKIEIADAQWIYDEESESLRPRAELGFFKQWWTRLFRIMSRVSYQYADEIITLYEGNRQLQIQDGADPDRCRIIPNGLNIERYTGQKKLEAPSAKKSIIVALVGRVVPIKDIKTFLNACKIICESNPRIECWICGPTDEDPEYYGDCLVLQSLLGLEGRVVFKGKLDLSVFYAQMDVVVLTSISEAQPLVILEANCFGIPCVATDVGSCRELLEGRTEADRSLGPSGKITGVANPRATAEAVLEIVDHDNLYLQMARAGKERVRRFYQEKDMFRRYENLYEEYL